MLNRRRGLKRLAWAFGVPYFGFWAFVALASWRVFKSSGIDALAYSRADNSDMAGIAWGVQNNAGDRIALSLIWGFVISVAVLVIFALGLWVYRGFKPQSAD